MRETARERGPRLVAEGRLLVRRVDDREVSAVCRGESGVLHQLGYRGGWFCTCEARTTCAHLYGLFCVVLAPPPRSTARPSWSRSSEGLDDNDQAHPRVVITTTNPCCGRPRRQAIGTPHAACWRAAGLWESDRRTPEALQRKGGGSGLVSLHAC